MRKYEIISMQVFSPHQRERLIKSLLAINANRIGLRREETRLFPANLSIAFFVHLIADPISGSPRLLGLWAVDEGGGKQLIALSGPSMGQRSGAWSGRIFLPAFFPSGENPSMMARDPALSISTVESVPCCGIGKILSIRPAVFHFSGKPKAPFISIFAAC